MGKRATRKPPPKKVVPKLPTSFDCPFCNNTSTVECTIDRKKSQGRLNCQICGAQYQTNITYITDPIDVYSEWIDECEKVNREKEEEEEDQVPQQVVNYRSNHASAQHQAYQDDEEEDDEEEEAPRQGYNHQVYNRGGYH
ncbi:hypothetical protein NAEGRDRAFT_79089 [Naegleria gruberi]|uniref:Transcription elongation factor 1 homolog n=1 Tax=Naegleria gruberi TaxID=5762 RepID=D2V9N6_NAEGR|nr:uncharacterized protein NAEGRDRAFT_79089 [Naegleria gruberi]EFC46615.1 hypothetical protein NAEGRDRAFT_79089 [Naegleria gruberi]|eukprot:XP_002679359.1 hypothetical protein NAEGRDRAFT_79089 [Naegleria gruberi strain NEG-M]